MVLPPAQTRSYWRRGLALHPLQQRQSRPVPLQGLGLVGYSTLLHSLHALFNSLPLPAECWVLANIFRDQVNLHKKSFLNLLWAKKRWTIY